MNIAVVIPCYKVKDSILGVLEELGPEVGRVFVVDDFCPENTGKFVVENCKDPRVSVLFNEANLGVGGATKSGYLQALQTDSQIIVKIDGDGQMNTNLIPILVEPIQEGRADYSKGNRFYDLESLGNMPKNRVFGNAVLSLMNKISTGYWNIFDPTNGFTAIHAELLRKVPLHKVEDRFFFESDLLFRINTYGAVVEDVPMDAIYQNEVSNLKPAREFFKFLDGHTRNTFKRIFYNYYLRDMSLASFELPLGLMLLSFGVIQGLVTWHSSISNQVSAETGTINLVALSVIVGLQFILAFFSYDISSTPKKSMFSSRKYLR